MLSNSELKGKKFQSTTLSLGDIDIKNQEVTSVRISYRPYVSREN
jgi:hypothetical protein